VGTRDPGFIMTELADYRATRRIVVRVNGWVMGMDKVPWVGIVDPAQLWVGYGYSYQAQCRTLMVTQRKHYCVLGGNYSIIVLLLRNC
jgi:hypothetical protein